MFIDTVILDRDGVINHDSDKYIKSPEEFILINKSLDAIYNLYKNNIKIFIATNQSGINRGLYSLDTFLNINNKLLNKIKLKFNTNIINSIHYCPHTPMQNCQCRKPLTGMIDNIITIHNINPNKTAFIGDSMRDLEAAHNAGCGYKYLVKTGKGLSTLAKLTNTPTTNSNFFNLDNVFDDLYTCVEKILNSNL